MLTSLWPMFWEDNRREFSYGFCCTARVGSYSCDRFCLDVVGFASAWGIRMDGASSGGVVGIVFYCVDSYLEGGLYDGGCSCPLDGFLLAWFGVASDRLGFWLFVERSLKGGVLCRLN